MEGSVIFPRSFDVETAPILDGLPFPLLLSKLRQMLKVKILTRTISMESKLLQVHQMLDARTGPALNMEPHRLAGYRSHKSRQRI
jgi:hypothetical protein